MPFLAGLFPSLLAGLSRLVSIPLFIFLWRFALSFTKKAVVLVAIWLGVTYVVYQGVDFALSEVEQHLQNYVYQLPNYAYQWFVYLGGKDAFAMMVSTATGIITLKGSIAGFQKLRFIKNSSVFF